MASEWRFLPWMFIFIVVIMFKRIIDGRMFLLLVVFVILCRLDSRCVKFVKWQNSPCGSSALSRYCLLTASPGGPSIAEVLSKDIPRERSAAMPRLGPTGTQH